MNHHPKRGFNRGLLTSACWVPLTVLFACGGTNSSESSAFGGDQQTSGNESVAGHSAMGGSRAASDSLAAGGTLSSGSTAVSTGGMIAAGGSQPLGGTPATSSAQATGGDAATGGTMTTGGKTATDGTMTTGGKTATGGTSTIGSKAATGGTMTTGGSPPNGGSSATGGTLSVGGKSSTGGTNVTGGSRSSGGNAATGGTKATGGATATGGASSGNCSTPPDPSPLVGWASVSGGTTGGGNATPVTVTTLAELQNAVKGTTAAVIYVKGVLSQGVVTIGSNKTIVGLCGAEIHGHVGLNKSTNVIIRNIKIVGYAVGDCSLDPGYSSATGCSSGDDAITVQGQSTHLWFDHDDISDGTDGNLDITHASDYITVSWTKFHYTPRKDPEGSDSTGDTGHRYSNLIGGSDTNGSEDTGHLRITWHHNWWADNVVERQPRVRFGQVHLFNNLWTSTVTNYCIGVGVGANIRDESNVFVGVKTPVNTTSYSDSTSAVRSTNNVYTNTTSSVSDLNAGSVFDPASDYSYTADAATTVQATIQTGAGPK